jgi:hypothetical protein
MIYEKRVASSRRLFSRHWLLRLVENHDAITVTGVLIEANAHTVTDAAADVATVGGADAAVI